MTAYAVRITPSNRQAIISEHNKFDPIEFSEWVDQHDTGYFVRDPNSPFDCHYLDDTVFLEIYLFEPGDEDALFRRITPI